MKIKSLKTLAALIAIALAFGGCEQPADGDFVAAGLNSIYAGRAVTASVGQPDNWTLSSNPPFTDPTVIGSISTIAGVAAGTNAQSGTIVAVAGTSGGLGYAASSYDGGATWTTGTASLPGLTRAPSVVHFLNGFYLATPGNSGTVGAYSADGIIWCETGYIGFGCKAGVYGAGSYVVGGQFGQAAYTGSLSANFNYIPQTITGWVGSGSAYYINAGAYGGGVYVFGGGSGRIAYTSTIDSITGWSTANTSAVFDSNDIINVIVYGDEDKVFVAIGGTDRNFGKAAFSIDYGATWQPASVFPIGVGETVYALAYGGGYFVAGDDGGNITYSDDGVTWVLVNSPFPSGTPINAITYDGASGRFIAVGGDTTNPLKVGFSLP
jgi:hypothetical protein